MEMRPEITKQRFLQQRKKLISFAFYLTKKKAWTKNKKKMFDNQVYKNDIKYYSSSLRKDIPRLISRIKGLNSL